MHELVHIENVDITIKEYRGQRVVTLKDIDLVHERPEGTARRNFNTNKKWFVEGEDYFLVSSDEIRTSRLFPISDNDYMEKVLITESGYLLLVKSLTDELAWKVQKQLINQYFQNRRLKNGLSPQLQALEILVSQMKQKELEDLQRDKEIQQLQKTTKTIKEAVQPISADNWRNEITKKIRKIQPYSGTDFQTLHATMYTELEYRAGCDLTTRLRNKKQRMLDNGCKKAEVNKIRKINLVEEDKRLKEIFAKIVLEYEIKYCS